MKWCRRETSHLLLIQTKIKSACAYTLGAFGVLGATPTPSWINAVLELSKLYNWKTALPICMGYQGKPPVLVKFRVSHACPIFYPNHYGGLYSLSHSPMENHQVRFVVTS